MRQQISVSIEIKIQWLYFHKSVLFLFLFRFRLFFGCDIEYVCALRMVYMGVRSRDCVCLCVNEYVFGSLSHADLNILTLLYLNPTKGLPNSFYWMPLHCFHLTH